MIFPLDKNALQADLEAFLAIPANRQARFDAAPDAVPACGNGVNEQEKRLHKGRAQYRVRRLRFSENGLLFLTLEAPDGTAPVFRPGQQARVYCPAVSYPLFLIDEPQQQGLFSVAASPVCQKEAFDYLSRLQVGDTATLRAPTGLFSYLPLRDRGPLVFITDAAGLPCAKAFADAIDSSAVQEIRFFCIGCLKEDFFDRRFSLIGSVDALPAVAPSARCFIAGDRLFCEKAYEKLGRADARICAVAPPKRAVAAPGTFSCTVITAAGEQTVPVSADLPLLSSLEQAGFRLPAECSSGECGFCRCRLLSGEVTQHTEKWQGDPRRRADADRNVIHACISFPDSDITITL